MAKSAPDNEVQLEGAQLLHDAALLRAWQAVRFVSLAAKGHWGINGAFLAPHLLRFLPSLLKLQVTACVGLWHVCEPVTAVLCLRQHVDTLGLCSTGH